MSRKSAEATGPGLEPLPVPGFPDYRVWRNGTIESRLGRRKDARGRWTPLKAGTGSGGYQVVVLNTAGRRMSRRVHTVVLETYVGPRPPGMEALHKNGNPADNAVTNLRWGTKLENAADKTAHGRNATGERHGGHRLTQEQVDDIRRRYEPGVNRWHRGNREILATEFGVCGATIMDIVRGRRWNTSTT